MLDGEMNNTEPPASPIVRSDVVQLLKRILADAESGKFKGIGVVMVPAAGNTPFMVASSGSGSCEIHAGCGALQSLMVQSIMMQNQSKILKPVIGHSSAAKKVILSG